MPACACAGRSGPLQFEIPSPLPRRRKWPTGPAADRVELIDAEVSAAAQLSLSQLFFKQAPQPLLDLQYSYGGARRRLGGWIEFLPWRAVESNGDSPCDNGPAAAGVICSDRSPFERDGAIRPSRSRFMRPAAAGTEQHRPGSAPPVTLTFPTTGKALERTGGTRYRAGKHRRRSASPLPRRYLAILSEGAGAA